MLQIFDWFAGQHLGDTRLTLVCIDAFPGVEPFHGLGQVDGAQIASLWPDRRTVTPAQLAVGRRAWAAFRSTDPRKIAALAAAPMPDLPFVPAAFCRHLEQFPSLRDGLSRTERQLLEAVKAGAATPAAGFLADRARERAPFMGDATIWSYLQGLNGGVDPLVVLSAPAAYPASNDFRQQTVALSERGRAVLAGHDDRLRLGGIDRWLGGVHLYGRDAV